MSNLAKSQPKIKDIATVVPAVRAAWVLVVSSFEIKNDETLKPGWYWSDAVLPVLAYGCSSNDLGFYFVNTSCGFGPQWISADQSDFVQTYLVLDQKPERRNHPWNSQRDCIDYLDLDEDSVEQDLVFV